MTQLIGLLEFSLAHRPARQAAIVVHVRKRNPSGMTLAHDIGLAARVSLAVQGDYTDFIWVTTGNGF